MTKIVGILNLTPDSFSDGGKHPDTEAVSKAITAMVAAGVDVIDVGAESTRPGAEPISALQEWQRLMPLLDILPQWQEHAVFSLDTRHADTAAKALEHGFGWINDVSGFSSETMIEAVKGHRCKLVFMHSLSIPADAKQVMSARGDALVAAMMKWANERADELEQKGIGRERLIFDPGLGFGKDGAQSLTLLKHASALRECGLPLLIGHSRKSFLKPYALGMSARDGLTLALSAQLMQAEVEYLRVHAVDEHCKLRDLHNAIEAA